MLTIGEFSKLCHVSPRILRHYDKMGLLYPEKVEAGNGYRYYSTGQLSVLARIETLKGYGFSLSEIRELLPLEKEALYQRIHQRRLNTYRELDNARKTLRRMENAMMEMEGTSLATEKYKVIVMKNPPQTVLGLKRVISVAQTHELFQELHRQAAEKGLKRTGVTQLVYLGEEFSYENMDVEAQVEVEEGQGTKIIPAGEYVTTIHIGPYDEVNRAYHAIWDWLAQHPGY